MSVTLRNSVIVAGILASIAAAALTFWLTYSKGPEFCSKKECINAASRILNSMDQTADPCNDFYQYACGGWIKNHPIPDDKPGLNNFNTVNDRNNRVLKDILNSNYTNDREAIKKAKIFYRSCMDEDAIEARGAEPALDMIERFGGMPLFGDNFDEDTFNIESFLAQTKFPVYDQWMHSSAPIIAMGVKPNDKNSSENIIFLDQPFLALPNRNSTIPAYRKFMHDYLAALWEAKEKNNMSSANNKEKILNSAVEEIIQFETDLAKIKVLAKDRTDISKLHIEMSLQDMATKVSSEFNWFQFVKGIMSRVDIEIQPTTVVVVYGKPYLTKLMGVLKKYENRVIKNYILWIKLKNTVQLLSKKFRDTEAPFRKATTGTSVEQPRFQSCNNQVNDRLPMPVAALFVKEMFSEKSKEVMDSMTANVITAFKNSLTTITWMDDETKKRAHEKAESVKQLIGYPDYLLDEDDPKLDSDLQELSVSVDKYFENFYNAQELQLKNYLRKLVKPVQRDGWDIGPAVVTAFYDANLNNIIFPAAILQSPFYDVGNSFSVNYGAIGSAIGHELTHGFDTRGSQFDQTGNLVNWWSNSSRMNFAERANCVRNQYGGFFYKTAELYVNGNSTIGENIADNGGIRQTYEGYQLWKKNNPKAEFALPGLEKFTPEQLFFIGNAQVWCITERQESAKQRIVSDVHSPGQFRTEGTFMNFEKFGEAYNCKRGQHRLYPAPEDTCRVW